MLVIFMMLHHELVVLNAYCMLLPSSSFLPSVSLLLLALLSRQGPVQFLYYCDSNFTIIIITLLLSISHMSLRCHSLLYIFLYVLHEGELHIVNLVGCSLIDNKHIHDSCDVCMSACILYS